MSRALRLEAKSEQLALKEPFRISGYVFEAMNAVVTTLSDGTHSGRGEANGVYYLGQDIAHMLDEIEGARDVIEAAPSREELLSILPPGGGRNAIDAALWELEARRTGKPVWALAGLVKARPLVTTFTLSANDPGIMAKAALNLGSVKAIKIKLTGEFDLDVERVKAIRAVRPDAWLGVDANQGFGIDELDDLVQAMLLQNVSLIEQPLARGREADLDGYRSPIPLAADESALNLADVPGLVGRFDVINIKLDKCGGLTEGLMIARAAREAGLRVMVGNMGGSSLSMAPAFVLGQSCDICDLDGPIFLKEDRAASVTYKDGTIWADDTVWGASGAHA
jgi:L-alanine-DL-glutamate epimerase-like enolase superfamily enzyme